MALPLRLFMVGIRLAASQLCFQMIQYHKCVVLHYLACPFVSFPKALAAGKLGTCVTIWSTQVIRSLSSEDEDRVRVGQVLGVNRVVQNCHCQVGPRATSGQVVLRPDFTAAQLDYKQLQNTDRQAKARKPGDTGNFHRKHGRQFPLRKLPL